MCLKHNRVESAKDPLTKDAINVPKRMRIRNCCKLSERTQLGLEIIYNTERTFLYPGRISMRVETYLRSSYSMQKMMFTLGKWTSRATFILFANTLYFMYRTFVVLVNFMTSNLPSSQKCLQIHHILAVFFDTAMRETARET